MDRANYALADFLVRSDVEVDLVTHRADPALAGHPRCHVRHVPRPYGLHQVGEPLLDLTGRVLARRRRADGEVTVVNGGNCLAAGVNWVHYVHALYRPELEPSLAGTKRWVLSARAARRERVALSRAPIVIANSDATRRAVVSLLGVPEQRAHTVYYGIDAAAFGAIDADQRARARQELDLGDRPAIAFVGALGDRRKGLDTLFAAFQRLRSEPGWDAVLLVVGTGAELETWRVRAEHAGLASAIRLLGFRSDVPFVLSACDLLVSPTRYEAFGLGVAEALARGLPAIVSAQAGVAELYPRELGELLLKDFESSEELAARLRWWRFESPNLRERLAPLVARVRGRSWDDMSREICGLMERDLQGRSARARTP